MLGDTGLSLGLANIKPPKLRLSSLMLAAFRAKNVLYKCKLKKELAPLCKFWSLFVRVDLVTLDDLSAEAMVESSQRIEQMASAYKRRAEALTDPGPPAILPPKIKRANLIVQCIGLWM